MGHTVAQLGSDAVPVGVSVLSVRTHQYLEAIRLR